MTTDRLDLSIIIPAYNEAGRLPPSLRRIAAYCDERPSRSTEIIVVDDGSTDGTAAAVAGVDSRVRVVSIPHGGKGRAVRAGILASRGVSMLVTDSDLSTPIKTLDRFWERRTEFDVILASRGLPDSVILQSQSRGKSFLGRLGNVVIRWLAVPGVYDTQCGFKLFDRRCRFLFERQRVEGWGFDIEILFLAKKYGFRILEVPVEWTNDAASKVRPFDYFRTLGEVFAIRVNDLRGFYR